MIANLLHILDTDSDNEGGSSSSDNFLNVSSSSSSISGNEQHAKITHFLEVIEAYSNKDFRDNFRINRTTALYLIDRYHSSKYGGAEHGGVPKVGARKEIYLFLWYMANKTTFRELGNLFGVSKSSAWRVLNRIVDWLISIGNEFISWPNSNEALQIMDQFQTKKKIPGVIGCIDCTHIEIKAPRENHQAYFNRNRYYSLNLQAVVDANKRFIDIFAGEPGSMHDSRVLRRSNLYQRASDNFEETFPSNSFILGDSAYSSLSWLVPPYRDNGFLSSTQRSFNNLHSSARIVVEHAFGLLKSRFRRLLHFTEQVHMQQVTNIIVCGCILHNICCAQNDELSNEETLPEPDSAVSDAPTQSEQSNPRRDQLLVELINAHVIS